MKVIQSFLYVPNKIRFYGYERAHREKGEVIPSLSVRSVFCQKRGVQSISGIHRYELQKERKSARKNPPQKTILQTLSDSPGKNCRKEEGNLNNQEESGLLFLYGIIRIRYDRKYRRGGRC